MEFFSRLPSGGDTLETKNIALSDIPSVETIEGSSCKVCTKMAISRALTSSCSRTCKTKASGLFCFILSLNLAKQRNPDLIAYAGRRRLYFQNRHGGLPLRSWAQHSRCAYDEVVCHLARLQDAVGSHVINCTFLFLSVRRLNHFTPAG